MDEMNDMGGAPADAGSGAGDEGGPIVIEITLNPDGSGTVDVETGAQEDAEEQGGEGPGEDTGGQPFKNSKECLSIVKDILDNGGQVAGAADQGAAKAGFNSVFDNQSM